MNNREYKPFPTVLKKKVYLIPHSHIDVEWYWNKEEGNKRAVLIINEVLKCMEKSSSFTFAQDNVIFFPYLLENLPEERVRILKEKIRDGKLEIVGGMWTQAEEAEPSGETLIRNILIGKNWVRKNFGIEVQTAWQIDTFGHIPQLPQILKKAEYKYLTFSRGVPPEIAKKIPNLFWGKSPDGSKILTLWLNKGYGTPLNSLLPKSLDLMYELFYRYREEKIIIKEDLKRIKKWLNELFKKSPGDYVFLPVGTDNFIPQDEILLLSKKLNDLLPEYNFCFSTPSSFFKEVEKENLEEINFDFPLPFYFLDLRGTWTGRCELKKAFRRYENTLLSAEKFSTISYILGNNYPKVELNLSWKDLVFTSFHDNIGGSHTDDVELASLKRLGMKKDTGMINELPEFILRNSLKYLTREIKDGVIVFNPHSFPVTDIIRLKDKTFLARNVPPLGYKTFRISKVKRSSSIKAGKNYLENRFFRIEFDKSGGIKRILDKRRKKELIDSSFYFGNELIAISHDGDLEGMLNLKKEIWRSSREKFSFRKKKENAFTSFTFNSNTRIGKIEKTIYLYEDLARIDFKTTIELKKSRVFLKVRFPLKMKHFKTFYSTQFAVVERKKGYFPAYDWVACEDDESGIALINTGNIGYWIDKNYLDLVLLWSVEQIRPPKCYTAPLANELGKHTFTYSLFPYEGKWRDSDIVKEGLLLNAPLIPYLKEDGLINQESLDIVPLEEKSFIKVHPEDFIVTAFKRSEDAKGLILRGYESKGEKKEVKISFTFPVKRCWICNLLEKREKELKVEDSCVSFPCNGFEIISLYLELQK